MHLLDLPDDLLHSIFRRVRHAASSSYNHPNHNNDALLQICKRLHPLVQASPVLDQVRVFKAFCLDDAHTSERSKKPQKKGTRRLATKPTVHDWEAVFRRQLAALLLSVEEEAPTTTSITTTTTTKKKNDDHDHDYAIMMTNAAGAASAATLSSKHGNNSSNIMIMMADDQKEEGGMKMMQTMKNSRMIHLTHAAPSPQRRTQLKRQGAKVHKLDCAVWQNLLVALEAAKKLGLLPYIGRIELFVIVPGTRSALPQKDDMGAWTEIDTLISEGARMRALLGQCSSLHTFVLNGAMRPYARRNASWNFRASRVISTLTEALKDCLWLERLEVIDSSRVLFGYSPGIQVRNLVLETLFAPNFGALLYLFSDSWRAEAQRPHSKLLDMVRASAHPTLRSLRLVNVQIQVCEDTHDTVARFWAALLDMTGPALSHVDFENTFMWWPQHRRTLYYDDANSPTPTTAPPLHLRIENRAAFGDFKPDEYFVSPGYRPLEVELRPSPHWCKPDIDVWAQ